MNLFQRWYGKLLRHRIRLLKFGTIGFLGVIVDVGGFNVLRYAGGHGPLYGLPLTAKLISTGVSIIVSWLGNRYWTFSERRQEGVHREFLAFLIISVIGSGISLSILAISHYVLDLRSPLADNLSANVLGLGLATLFRYWAMHKHVFTGVSAVKPANSAPAEPALRG